MAQVCLHCNNNKHLGLGEFFVTHSSLFLLVFASGFAFAALPFLINKFSSRSPESLPFHSYGNKYDDYTDVECTNVGLTYEEFLDEVLFRNTIYDDFTGESAPDLGYYTPKEIFKILLQEYFEAHPKAASIRIIEVGSWGGRSTTELAKLCEELSKGQRTCSVIAVDTWVGQHENYEGFGMPRTPNGNLLIYDYFMNNVKNAGYTHVITPFRITSSSAAHVFSCFNVTVDIVYLDADHDYPAVLFDMYAYYRILKPGGLLLGDDIVLGGVRRSLEEFSAAMGESHSIVGEKWKTWVIRKRTE